jgi:hypothetical protein
LSKLFLKLIEPFTRQFHNFLSGLKPGRWEELYIRGNKKAPQLPVTGFEIMGRVNRLMKCQLDSASFWWNYMEYIFKIPIACESTCSHSWYIVRTRLVYYLAVRPYYRDIDIPVLLTLDPPLDDQLITILIDIRIEHRYALNGHNIHGDLSGLDEVYSPARAACQSQKQCQ